MFDAQYIEWFRQHKDPKKRNLVPLDYEARFLRACATFKHQVVFCPDQQVRERD